MAGIQDLDPKVVEQFIKSQESFGKSTKEAEKELLKTYQRLRELYKVVHDINIALESQTKTLLSQSKYQTDSYEALLKQLKINKEKNIYESKSLNDIKKLTEYKKSELEDDKKRLVAEKQLLEKQKESVKEYEARQRILSEIKQKEEAIAEATEKGKKLQDLITLLKKAQEKVDRQYMTTQQKISEAQKKAAEFTKKQKEYKQMIQGLDKKDKDYLDKKKLIEEMAAAEKDSFMKDNEFDPLAKMSAQGGFKGHLADMAGTTGSNMLSKLGVDLDFSSLTKGITSISGLLGGISDVLGKDIVTAVGVINAHMGKVNAALYGNTENKSFSSMLESINENIGASPYMSQQTLAENIAKFAESGISYNVEQRAFWYTLQEDLVQGFDALDSSLSRIIRLQQADMTEQGIGTASKLTMLLNSQFKDTEYMTSQYNSVYAAIVDAMSTMDTDQATQFNFNLQKWLSAMYALGLSDSAVSSIASAMNMLATGDLSGLSGTQAQTLLALSTNNTSNSNSKSYASYLVSGMTGADVDEVMQSMVEYLKSIAENTDSNVLKSEWGNILNLSMSDWKAISNLTDEDISTLANYDVTQQVVLDETTSLIQDVFAKDRMHLSQKIENALANASFSYGMGIANNETAYGIYRVGKVLNTLSSMTGSSVLGILAGVSSLATIVVGAANFIEAVGATLKNDGGLGGFHNSNLFNWTVQRGGGTTTAATADSVESLSESLSLTSSGKTTLHTSSSGETHGGGGGNRTFAEVEEETEYADDFEEVETSSADAEATDFQARENSVSGTAENILSGESTVARDINELYAELFENQTTPIRVRLAEFEDSALIELAEISGGSSGSPLSNTASDTLSILRNMRGASTLL